MIAVIDGIIINIKLWKLVGIYIFHAFFTPGLLILVSEFVLKKW